MSDESTILRAHRALTAAGVPINDDHGRGLSLPLRIAVLAGERDALASQRSGSSTSGADHG